MYNKDMTKSEIINKLVDENTNIELIDDYDNIPLISNEQIWHIPE